MPQTAPLTIETLIARAEISDVVNRYPTGIDRRDWALFRSCFEDEIDHDFESFTGIPLTHLVTDDWVASVRGGLSGFDATQHISTNHVHEIEGDQAACVSYMVALHYLVDGPERRMHGIGGYYTNRLRRGPEGWKIHACKLTVTWEMGDRALFQIAMDRWKRRHVL
jgi:hypothetical protein